MSSEIVHNRYRVHEKIGAGAVGQVYKAYDEQAQRFVALKTIPANAQDDVILRFLREAEVTARLLKHPNVVEVYEFGRDKGKLFIAMELLDGSDQIKIIDFGLVRLAESDMTRTGAIMGTPSYMSPEQAEGRKAEAAADVFSLGAVFYELLTYKKAFKSDSILSTLFLILNDSPDPIRDLVPDVPDSMVEVIDRALSKDPDDRFADANALHDALASLIEEPVLSRSSHASKVLLAALTEQSGSSERTVARTQGRPRSSQDNELRGFTGNLKKTSLSVLLPYCSESSTVGALHLRRGPIEKRLFFVGGRLLSTTTNSPRETLGQLLIRTGCLSEDQLRQSLAEQERSREPL
jgi:serine/threonine protein kinase